MKQNAFVCLLFLVCLFSIMPVSAGFFENFLSKMTGNSIDELDITPRIAIWAGKATQHTEEGRWVTDPDGLAYAVISPDLNTEEYRLNYCRKYYGNSVIFTREYKKETITTWMTRWNQDGPYTSTNHITYECVMSGNSFFQNDSQQNVTYPACSDTCSSLGYQCGIQEVCGESVNCGICRVGQECIVGGKCSFVQVKNNSFSNSSLNLINKTENDPSLNYTLNLTNVTDSLDEDILNRSGNFSRDNEQLIICSDTCSSLGYQCGIQEVCGESVNCGSCLKGDECNWAGVCEGSSCDFGCFFEGECLFVGDRKKELFCSNDFILTEQKDKFENCLYGYECSSNVCKEGACRGLNFFQRIFEFLRR